EFEADLQLLYASLVQNRGENIARLVLDPLLRKVRSFGFHLATLDIRQHAAAHRQALEAASDSSRSRRSEAVAVSHAAAGDSMAENVLQTLRSISKWKRQFPAIAIRNYVFFKQKTAYDIYGFLRLAGAAGVQLRASGTDPGVMPVPLFESIQSLRDS